MSLARGASCWHATAAEWPFVIERRGTFSVTDCIGHTPPGLPAKNFGLPESAFATFPKEEVYFARGKYRLLAQSPHATYRGGREWRVDSRRFPIAESTKFPDRDVFIAGKDGSR
ncbi:hypothetical protein [Bradyrhizobium icense]|uniref:Uncharacterized protein n=1 Tax=Bradyrhizobium icense TaxID=1274631 RepID=A0A1B1UFW2_9BRAD|nr:hypothetical protein [Bradyrhizobium icense]ANW01657.1 hypothetical protein LMTR13_17215 [Bradyrhizobium icense]